MGRLDVLTAGSQASRKPALAGGGPIELGQIRPVIESARAHGVHVDELFEELGYADPIDQLPDATPLKLSDYYRLQRLTARTLDDLTLKLSERKLTYKTGDFVLSQMASSRTLKEAAERLCEYFNMMHGDAYNSARVRGESLVLTVDDSTFPYTFRENEALTLFVGDTVLIKVHCILDSLSQGLAERALQRVSVVRSREAAGNGQTRFWDVPVHFGQAVYELVYDFDIACQQIEQPEEIDLSNVGLFSHVIDWLDRRQDARQRLSFAERVRELIADGLTSQTSVAAKLQMSPATLRRKLADEDMSFRALVLQDRLVAAQNLLAAGQSVSAVSDSLGYSDVRAFNRASKKALGITPAKYAEASKAETGASRGVDL